MKILRVIARLNVGGPARHVVLLDRGLRARGHETVLVHGALGDGEGSFEHLAREEAVKIAKIPELGRRISVVDDIRAFFRLVRLTFERQPDVIHTHTAKAGTVGRLAAVLYNATRPRSRRALTVHTFHGHVLSGYFGPVATTMVRLIERALAWVATDRIITISPAQQRDIVNRFRICRAGKTTVVPLGLDLTQLLELTDGSPNLREKVQIGPGAIVVGFVGRFVPIKDLSTLVGAFAHVAKRQSELMLLLAGDGPLRPALQAQIRALGIAERVRFVGWCDELAALHATLDICVISSLNEGTPVAAIEAMAAGRPVVATAVGGVPDLIDDGRTGVLVPPGDVARLALAIEQLAASPEHRHTLGAAARTAVAGRFSSERLVDDIDRLYSEGVAAKRHG